MVAFKQPANLRKLLCHAKLPPMTKLRTHPERTILGMRKCGKPCPIDIHVWPSKKVTSTLTGETHTIQGETIASQKE